MQLLTLSEMAGRVNRSTKTFRKYVLEYSVPHVRLGRDLLFDEAEVLAYLKTLTDKKQEKRLKLARPRVRARLHGKGRFADQLGL